MSIELQQEKRDKWPSRLSFVVASMGATVGIGNLLRYPSIAARHYGLQWFIPYFLALFLIGIPMLALEIVLGQSMRGGATVANNAVHRRLRGIGTVSPFGLVGRTAYIILMSWILVFLRHSFTRPLPWLSNPKFFAKRVVRNFEAVQSTPDAFFSYPRLGIVGETLGWTVLTWLLVYLCLFLGVGLTGHIVYFTMLVPLVLCVVLLVRAVSLPRAYEGVRLYAGIWRSDVLASGKVWQDAIIQIFFSLGTGFGTFTAYASYNTKSSNAVQDVLIIGLFNSLIEVFIGFAAFAIVGFRNIDLNKKNISTFELGFITYPAAFARIPGSNFWCVLFFLTVYLLAIDSVFAYLESIVTIVTDVDCCRRLPKPLTVAIIILISLGLSIVYTTEFGSALLNAMDLWGSGITVSFATWFQCVTVTGIYRYKDVISQTGRFAFVAAQTAYFGSMVIGVIVGRFMSFWLGILTFAAILAIGTFQAMALSNAPEIIGSFGCNTALNKLWWLTSYSGHQLMRDLNEVVGQGKNWKLPFFWAPILRWITAPVLIVNLTVSYKRFSEKKHYLDPLHCFAFAISHVGVALVVLGFVCPQSLSFLVPEREHQADKRQYSTAPGKTLPSVEAEALEATVEEAIEPDSS